MSRWTSFLQLCALLAIGVFLVAFASFRVGLFEPESGRPVLLAPANMKYFTLGYDDLVADGLWLRTIQDFDYCENRSPAAPPSNAVKCNRGWVFHMIDATTNLAPRFRQPYLSGALMLTILVNDIDGASVIFDKAVAAFPNDRDIAFSAAYQALIEEHNPEKASQLLIRAGKNGAPPWVFALASRLLERKGQLALARATLEEALTINPTGPGAERIQQRLDEIEAEQKSLRH